jgi:hypothetical protein
MFHVKLLVDDEIFARTQVAPFVDDDYVLTSERLHACSPHPSPTAVRAKLLAGAGTCASRPRRTTYAGV